MKKSILVLCGLLAACAHLPTDAHAKTQTAPLRVGVYVDDGARANGWAAWLRLLHSSPQIKPTLLDGASVRNGALDRIDVFVMPGGNSLNEGTAMQLSGRNKLKAWIANGGRYFGTCAGCSFLMQNDDRFIKLIPYRRNPSTPSGGSDWLNISVTERGEELTGIKAGIHPQRYHGGPLLVSTNVVIDSEIEVIGTWQQDYRSGNPSPSMVGYPSLLCGRHGQGKLFATTGHPEHFLRTRDFIVGGFRYLTGVEVSFTPPKRPRGGKTVGFYTPCVAGIATAQRFLELDSDPSLVVIPVQADDLKGSVTNQLKEIVFPAGNASSYTNNLKTIRTFIDTFTANGGTVINESSISF
jgi:hypothetical protein